MAKKYLSMAVILLIISVIQFIFISFFLNGKNRYEDSDVLIYYEPALVPVTAIPIIGFIYNQFNKYGYIVVKFKYGSPLAKKTVGFSYRLQLERADINMIDWDTIKVKILHKSINIYDKENDILRIFVPDVYIACP